jgi:hypothetical protein
MGRFTNEPFTVFRPCMNHTMFDRHIRPEGLWASHMQINRATAN